MLPLSFSVYLLVRLCKKKHFTTLFIQIKRLLKSLVMVTFSSATDDFFEYRSDVAFERTDAFPEVNQQTKSFDTKVKTTFKVFRVFFL